MTRFFDYPSSRVGSYSRLLLLIAVVLLIGYLNLPLSPHSETPARRSPASAPPPVAP